MSFSFVICVKVTARTIANGCDIATNKDASKLFYQCIILFGENTIYLGEIFNSSF